MTRIPTLTIVIGAEFLALLCGKAISAQDKYGLKVPRGLSFLEFRGYEGWQVVATSQNDKLSELATYVVEKGKPLVELVNPNRFALRQNAHG